MKRLLNANRVEEWREGKTLGYVLKLTDYGLTPITNVWNDTALLSDKMYVVQTSVTAIARCMLMTTDPGDLVLDPTCGAGTTAYVAEKWGRRWITCDTSRVAIAIAKQRLMTAKFEWYELAHPDEGVRSGFKYKAVPHITLDSIANNKPVQEEIIYDQPKTDNNKIRVTGPFTVESIVPPTEEHVKSATSTEDFVDNPSNPGGNHVIDMLGFLTKAKTVNFPNGKKLQLENVRPLGEKAFLHAEAESMNGEKTRIAISFGPRHGPVTVRQLEEAIAEAQWDYNLLILAGFSFDPEVQAFIQKNPHPRLNLQLAHINPDVLISDLLKTPKGSQIFSVFGQPDIELKKKNEEHVVELKGVDIYDPISGTTEQSKGEDAAAWFLDTDYDGYTFRISQAFFPNPATSRNPWDRLENALHGIIDEEKMERFRSTTSLTFKSGDNKKIAVKVIDLRGNEVIAVRDLSGRSQS